MEAYMTAVRRARAVVIAIAFIALIAKGWLAWNTTGQDDTYILWPQFLQAVDESGPYGIYGLPHPGWQVYNHPPLAGWWLMAIDIVDTPRLGWPLGFWIRIGSCVADFLCALVIFEVVQRRAKLWKAAVAGALVGASPVLFVISGYHGNHDAEMMFFAILAAYLLVDRKMPLLAGLALAISISYKLPVLVAIPAILVAAVALGWRSIGRFMLGFGGFVGVVWLPALLYYFEPYMNNVMLYKANSFPQQWGLVQFAQGSALADFFNTTYTDNGRFLLVVLCGLMSSYVAWRRPDLLVAAIGLAMSTFLLLSPGYAPQYHVWPLAALYAIGIGFATLYNIGTGIFLIAIYTAWSGGLPWDKAATVAFLDNQVTWAAWAWVLLLVTVAHAVWYLWRETRKPRLDTADTPALVTAEIPGQHAHA
jgi:hypothetical protein